MILYIDPGTSGLIINFLIAVFSSFVYFFRKLFFKKIIKKDSGQFEISLFSEGNQYKNTFLPIVNELIKKKICFNYYTLDYKDKILDIENEFVNSSFLGIGSLGHIKFNSLSSKILLSTTPNLGNKNYPLKKPKKVKELVHVWHSIDDISYYKKGSLDFYDTILTVGDFQNESIRKIENLRNLTSKKIIPVGLPYFDEFLNKIQLKNNPSKTLLIGSSWGNKGLLKRFGFNLIEEVIKSYKVIVRPHPQSFVSEKIFIEDLKKKCLNLPNLEWDESNDPLNSFSKSSLLISDTSAIRYDYSFLTNKPVITLKIEKNSLQEYEADYIEDIWGEKTEHLLGSVINENNLSKMNKEIESLLKNGIILKSIKNLKEKTIFSIGKSSKNIVEYLISNVK
tara:strand:- start:231 stop:1412 length:1182 start_codon:yes stop_codon:yes gene_type:complete